MFSVRKILIFLILLDIILLLFLIPLTFSKKKETEKFPELRYLKEHQLDFNHLKIYFTDLANKKGAEYAYRILKDAQLRPGIDIHLMGHVVGEVLYKQQGAKGIEVCTQDFRNACSHTIVVGLFSDKGEQALPEIAKACQHAPGGKGAYALCFHGLGHGVLAFTGYNLEKTIKLCEKTATTAHNRREFSECVSGAIMELISGGDHDKALWSKQSAKYLTTNDPLYPCDAYYMPQEVRPLCYVYLTPHLFIYAGAQLGHPLPSDYKKAFTYCNALTETADKKNREECYGGFGKEFVVLAKNRDVRNIDKMSKEELQKAIDWCMLADSSDGRESCMIHAVASLYWGGENSFDTPIKFCAMIESYEEGKSCFSHLISMVTYFKDSYTYRKDFCSSIPAVYQGTCKKSML